MLPVEPRPYRAEDLPRLTGFLGRVNAANNLRTYLHPGDLRHHLSNTMRGADPAEYFHVVDGPDGDPLALIELSKRADFTVEVDPGLQGDFEREVLRWTLDAQRALLDRRGSDAAAITTSGLDGDSARATCLAELGFSAAPEPMMALTVRELSVPWAPPVLPEGFSIRPAAGLEEADAIGAVHGAAFKSNWTPGLYRKVMETPGFDIDHEMLVVAPSGEFAAFLVYWLDPITKSGLFEPVGTAEAYQRRGLTKALMTHTLGLMRDAGMTRAVVLHELDNPASSRAYASLGFERKATFTMFTRPV